MTEITHQQAQSSRTAAACNLHLCTHTHLTKACSDHLTSGVFMHLLEAYCCQR